MRALLRWLLAGGLLGGVNAAAYRRDPAHGPGESHSRVDVHRSAEPPGVRGLVLDAGGTALGVELSGKISG